MAILRGTGDGRRQLPDRHEPGRRPVPGAGPRHDQRLVQRVAVVDRPGAGAQDGRRPDRGRGAGRALRPDHHRHGRHRHRAPLMGTFASRGTHRVGNAVKMAALEAREAVLQLASEELEASVADLVLDGKGSVFVVGRPTSRCGIADLASRAQFQYGRTIAGRGVFMKPKSEVDPETGAMDPDSTQAWACTVAEVEVDTETGDRRPCCRSGPRTRSAGDEPRARPGADHGRGVDGLSHALYETTEPYYPIRDHSPARLRRVPDARARPTCRESSPSSSRSRRPTGRTARRAWAR